MSVTIKDVEYIAGLAKLTFSEEELAELTADMTRILDYMKKLNELNTDDVEPLSNPLDLSNVFREDIPGQSLSTFEALKNTPDSDDKYFKVPKVITQKK